MPSALRSEEPVGISATRGKRVACLAALACMGFAFLHCEKSPVSTQPAEQAVFTPALSATNAEVRGFLAKGQGGTHAKLVYIDRTLAPERLCYLDFSETGEKPAVHVISAANQPEVPVISPDGNWVVYASGDGTEAGSALTARSSIYLARLSEDAQPMLLAADSACEPRFVQNVQGKLSVIYATLDPDLAWQGHGQTRRIDIDISGAQPVASPAQVVWAKGGYSAGLSWDNRYLSAGGGLVARLDLLGAKQAPDTLAYNMVQACNASASSSRIFTNTLMYLNTDGIDPKINGGKEWGEWQAILIGDSSKSLLKGYTCPATFANPIETEPKSFTTMRWHHPEWSNHPYFAAATLNVDRFFKSGSGYANTGYQERIYLLNLKDSTYLEVVRPDAVRFTGKSFDASGFYWPWLWVEVPEGFQEAADWLAPK